MKRQSIPRRLFAYLRFNWRSLLLFTVIYRFLGILLLIRLITLALDVSLRFQPYRYVSEENAVAFFTSPMSLVCIVILIALFLLYIYFEAGIILCGLQASASGRRIGMIQMASAGSHRMFLLLRGRLFSITLPLTAFLFVSNLFFLYELLYRVNPFCTWLPMLFNQRASRIILVLAVVFCAAIAFSNYFSIHYLVYTDEKGKQARRSSRRLFARHIPILLLVFLLITGFAVLLWWVMRLVLGLIAATVASFLAPPDILVALVLTMQQYINLFSLLVASTAGFLLHFAASTGFFYYYTKYTGKDHVLLYRDLLSHKSRRLILAGTLLVSAGIIGYYGYNIYRGTLHAERAINTVRIAAHRGFSSKAPENTVAAVEMAADYLADYAEIDVQCTSDGEVVLFHDRNFARVAGDSRKLQDLSYGDLASIDIGKHFSLEYSGLTVNTLAEALEAARGRVELIVELKRNSMSGDLPEKVLALIEEYDMKDQCIIQSADKEYLQRVKELDPDMTTGLILTTSLGTGYTKLSYVDFFCMRSILIRKNTVKNIHKAGKEVFAWTINTSDEMERMKQLQVDVIITDYPIMAREVLLREDQTEFLQMISEQLQKAADDREKGEGFDLEGFGEALHDFFFEAESTAEDPEGTAGTV